MNDEEKLLTGAWLDAIGTIISAIAEVRNLIGENGVTNDRLVAIGEGLQAVGTLLIGTATVENPLDFSGNWIDGVGAGASSVGAYLQSLDEENRDALLLETLGDAFQSMGAAISSYADLQEGELEYALGNAIQSFGAGLEAIGGAYELNEKELEAQPITTIGAIFQAIGSNYNALLVTREFLQNRET